MAMMPHILFAQVMHKRLIPKINAFNYGLYYLAFPLSQQDKLADGWRFGVNQRGVLSFYDRDHGPCDGTSLLTWARQILIQENLDLIDGEIVLVALPRVFGYVFNPVSFWLCYDRMENLRAVLCEVNNTFGEKHTYLCVHDDQRVIHGDNVLQAKKLFHVSPFLHREGHYDFRFSIKGDKFGVWINHFNEDGEKMLLTALTGTNEFYSKNSRREAFWRYPLVTYRAIFLIHWQALKLIIRGIRYIAKPAQLTSKLVRTGKNAKI